jgi:hypothetical protein
VQKPPARPEKAPLHPGRTTTGGAEHPSRTHASNEAKPDLRKESNTMKRICAIAALALSSLLLMASAAYAVAPGTYGPDAGSFNSANAPGSSHLTSGSPSCTVNADLSIDCSAYVLGGVGHTNATVSLTANYTAIVDCFNPGTNPQNPIESHTTTFSPTDAATVASTRNGQLRVPTRSVSFSGAPVGCPNANWTPTIRPGSVQLLSFRYTLTFAGFSSPYITISEP